MDANADFDPKDTDEMDSQIKFGIAPLIRTGMKKKVEKYPDFFLDVINSNPPLLHRKASEPLPTELARLRNIRIR